MKQKPLDPEVLRYWQGYFSALAYASANLNTAQFPPEVDEAMKTAYYALNRVVNLLADEADKPRRKAQKRKK